LSQGQAVTEDEVNFPSFYLFYFAHLKRTITALTSTELFQLSVKVWDIRKYSSIRDVLAGIVTETTACFASFA